MSMSAARSTEFVARAGSDHYCTSIRDEMLAAKQLPDRAADVSNSNCRCISRDILQDVYQLNDDVKD